MAINLINMLHGNPLPDASPFKALKFEEHKNTYYAAGGALALVILAIIIKKRRKKKTVSYTPQTASVSVPKEQRRAGSFNVSYQG